MSDTDPLHERFPPTFRFGAATAAYQIEGAVAEDGRKPSIWDAFAHAPGRVANGDTGDVACDHYHRVGADLDLAAALGLDAYRFSVAWPRVVPDGRGASNARGLDFYDRLVDACLERGLAAFPTLYHWDLPLALGERGGWTARATAAAFADYADVVARRLGDRVSAFATFNEPWCSALMGHLYGLFAPGATDLDQALAAVHHQHLAHGLAVQALRAACPAVPLGIVLNLQTVTPLGERDEDHAAAERHRAFHNGTFLEPLFEGRYPEAVVAALGERLPAGFEDDLGTIAQPLDWWGLNWYTPTRVTADDAVDAPWPATRAVVPDGVATSDIGWEIAPEGLTALLVELRDAHDLPPCWITENGACINAGPGADGRVDDAARADYVERHLHALAEAIDAGCDVRGYFAWSLMDNFEWAEGYAMRFGLVHVDYATQRRTVKGSGERYRQLIEAHRERRADVRREDSGGGQDGNARR